jgi:hypothetical protein
MRKNILAATLGVGAMMLACRGAHAGYQVITYAQSGVTQSNTSLAVGYNAGGVDAHLGTGYKTFGGGGGTTGGGSPTDTIGNSTFSSVNSSDSEFFPADGINFPDQSASASAQARASLSQGLVAFSGAGTYLDREFVSGQSGGSGQGFAQNSDVLHFSIPGASASTVTNLSITFSIDGNLLTSTAAGDSAAEMQANLTFAGGHFAETFDQSGSSAYQPVASGLQVTGWAASSFSSNTAGKIIFNGTISVTGPTADVSVAETLSGFGALGSSANYYNTGVVSISSPAGVTYTSDSGVFLSNPVPEPGIIALVGLALPMLATRRRRRIV